MRSAIISLSFFQYRAIFTIQIRKNAGEINKENPPLMRECGSDEILLFAGDDKAMAIKKGRGVKKNNMKRRYNRVYERL
jgi:hypothetical protein